MIASTSPKCWATCTRTWSSPASSLSSWRRAKSKSWNFRHRRGTRRSGAPPAVPHPYSGIVDRTEGEGDHRLVAGARSGRARWPAPSPSRYSAAPASRRRAASSTLTSPGSSTYPTGYGSNSSGPWSGGDFGRNPCTVHVHSVPLELRRCRLHLCARTFEDRRPVRGSITAPHSLATTADQPGLGVGPGEQPVHDRSSERCRRLPIAGHATRSK